MAALHSRYGHCILQLWFLSSSSSSFFPRLFSALQIGCLPYFHTWCGLSANLECTAEMCCTRLAENTGHKNCQKVRHLHTITQNCWTISSQQRHVLTIGKKLVKQQYLLHMSSLYGLPAKIGSGVWGTTANFNGFCLLGFITAWMLLSGGQPNFAQCLAVSWTGTLCIHFWGLLHLTEFCQVQSSPCIQVLHSAILAALLQGTRAVDVSQTLQCGTRNGITELLQRAPPIFRWRPRSSLS